MADRPSVPKFGNWETQENVPYTVFFDKARKKRPGTATKMINPNDPRQNPELFSNPKGSSSRPKPQQDGYVNNRGRQEKIKIREEPGFRQFPVVPVPVVQARGEIENQRYGSEHVGRSKPVANARNEQRGAAVIPKFGVWDENSSVAAEGFTHIFDQVREDKHKTGTVAGIPTTPSRPTNHRASSPNTTNSCCFPWSRKRRN